MECADAWILHPCEGEVELEVCPFAEEIRGEIVFVYLCRYHLRQRAMDI